MRISGVVERLKARARPTDHAVRLDSRDDAPWEHPFLTGENISSFRVYSESVWQRALADHSSRVEDLDIGFAVNIAQNMYKWARMAGRGGARATLYLHPFDDYPMSLPAWEHSDDEFESIDAARSLLSEVEPDVPVRRVAIDSPAFRNGLEFLEGGDPWSVPSRAVRRLVVRHPSIRWEVFARHPLFMSYFDWAAALAEHDVLCATSNPFAAYASGRPYAVCSIGADLQFECGRGDDYGRALLSSFNSARHLFISNPHSLGHSRRLGLTNGLYVPYPMDTDRYSPGKGRSRDEWVRNHGDGVFVLSTARLDDDVKGNASSMLDVFGAVASSIPDVRFVLIAWGTDVDPLKARLTECGLLDRVILLKPAGKMRLLDYYRSCDIVIDQFRYGYFGATMLEAASTGRPVVMKLHGDQYGALYAGDGPPVVHAGSTDEVVSAVLALARSRDLRESAGAAMRSWVVRNHGEEKSTRLLLSLLGMVAESRHRVPEEDLNPLLTELSEEEVRYHRSRLVEVPL